MKRNLVILGSVLLLLLFIYTMKPKEGYSYKMDSKSYDLNTTLPKSALLGSTTNCKNQIETTLSFLKDSKFDCVYNYILLNVAELYSIYTSVYNRVLLIRLKGDSGRLPQYYVINYSYNEYTDGMLIYINGREGNLRIPDLLHRNRMTCEDIQNNIKSGSPIDIVAYLLGLY